MARENQNTKSLKMDLDDIASTPAPETIPPPRARATSFGGNRCKVQFVGKDKATNNVLKFFFRLWISTIYSDFVV